MPLSRKENKNESQPQTYGHTYKNLISSFLVRVWYGFFLINSSLLYLFQTALEIGF